MTGSKVPPSVAARQLPLLREPIQMRSALRVAGGRDKPGRPLPCDSPSPEGKVPRQRRKGEFGMTRSKVPPSVAARQLPLLGEPIQMRSALRVAGPRSYAPRRSVAHDVVSPGLEASGARTKGRKERPKSIMCEPDARRASSIDFSDEQPFVSPRLLSRDFFGSFFYPEKNERRILGVLTLLWLISTALLLPLSSHAQDTLPFEDLMEQPDPAALAPLEGYLEMASAQNPGLRATFQEYRAQTHVGTQVGSLPDPELSLSFFANPPDQAGSIPGRLSGSVMQRVPWFGTLSTRRSEQDHRADAKRLELEQEWLDLMAEVHQRYFAYFRIRQSIRFMERHIELLDDLEPVVRTRYETARASGGQVDLLRIEMEQEEIQTDIADLRHMGRHLQAEFNELLNRDARAEIELPDGLPMADLHYAGMHDHSSDTDLMEIIRDANPGLAAYEKQQAAERDAIRLSQLEGRPSFGVGLQVMGRDHTFMRMMPEMNESITALASIQIPIFRGKYRAQRQEAEARMEATRLRQQQQTNALASQLESYLHSYHDATRRIDLNRNRLIPRADQAVQVLREDYSAGRTPFDEVIRMQRQILDYGVALIEAQVKQHQARATIEALLAQPPAGHELRLTD